MMYSTNILLNLISTIFKTINSSVDDTRKTLALFNKDWNTYKTNWQNANGFWGKVGSVFAPSKSTSVTPQQLQILKNWNNAVKHGCTNQETFNRIIADADDKTKLYFAGLNKGKGSVEGLKNAQNVAKASTIGLTIAQTALNAAISMGIGILINLAITGITKLVNANKEAIESANELREKYADFKETNASNISTLKGLKDEFTELSKGVSQYGDNISLTTEQYDRYREIVQQIVGMSPSLAEGYDTENGYIADKNGLLERAIELQEIEYRNELRKITNLQNLKTSMAGYIAEYKEAFEGGFVTEDMSAISTEKATDFSNALYQAFNFSERYDGGYKSEDLAREILTSLGVDNIDREMEKFFNENGYYQSSWFFSKYADEIANNIDAVANALSFEGVGLDEDEFENRILTLKDCAQAYLDMKDSISMANESIQTDLRYIAEYADGYDSLSSEQQKFVNDFLKGFNIDDITSRDWFGNLAYDEDKMKSVKRQINDFVEALSQDETTKDALSKLYAIPTDSQSVGDFVSQFRSALDTVRDYCEENGIEIPLGISESETEINELGAQYNRVVEYVKGKFDGYDFSDFFKTKSINSKEELDKFLEIAQGANTATEAMEKYVQSSTSLNKMTVSLSELEKTSDNIKTLSSAFKELSEDGYTTTKTLGEIKTATGLADDEWEEYQAKLMRAKVGSSEFNQAMSELTYKILDQTFANKDLNSLTEEQIASTLRENGVVNANAVAREYLTQAKRKEEIQSILTSKATDKEISSLIKNANSCGVAKNAYLELVAKEILFNNNELDVKDKVDKINKIAIAAGFAGAQVEYLNNKLSGKDKKTQSAELGIEVIDDKNRDNYDKLGWQYKYNGVTYEKFADARAMAEMDKLVEGFSSINIVPNYSGAASNSGSDKKNEALDNYLKNAENLYKVHQNEEKYINDLVWAQNNLVKSKEEELDVTGKINEAYRDLADNRIKDLEHQIDLTKELKGEDTNVIDQLNEIQRVAHDEANRLRDMGYDDNSNEIQDLQKTWWDAQNEKLDFYQKQHDIVIKDIEHARDMALNADENANVTSYYKQLQAEYHKEAERLRALDPKKYKEQIQELQKLWWDAQNEILDYNKSVVDDFLNELQEKLDKSFDIRISRLNSESTLLSSHFDLVNAITEEQHNLNKELLEAETIGARMNEQERKSLFTKDEHNKLSSKLNDIMVDITDLQSDYMRDLERATEDTIEEVTNQYERQYELKMKEYEIVKAELNLVKKQQILENVENEKSVRTWNGSNWIYAAVLQDVINAKEDVANAEYELAKAKTEEAQRLQLNAIDANVDALQTEKNKLATTIEDLAKSMNSSGKDITETLQTIAETDLPTFDAIIQEMGESIKEALDISDADISKVRKTGVSSRSFLSNYESNKKDVKDILESNYSAHKSSTGQSALLDVSRKAIKNLFNNGYASGTSNAKKGLNLFDEDGFGSELILTNDGILTQFNGGERVFSPEMADRLWEMAQKNNILTASIPQLDFSKLVPIEERINNAISNISNVSGDTYMIKDVQLNESEGGTLKGFIDFLKKKI